ncbi:hypothetical protein BD289DRAFT_30243 [Coniella lustricola]|uniref:Uncharacterized protein n=1 Tax=Coniella lustricola TaxID=2025994 RepID=A0A2T3A2U7_9PEZI|nr:hypothetical protein BD289DRAFT_30243 [Coniella lustricola]
MLALLLVVPGPRLDGCTALRTVSTIGATSSCSSFHPACGNIDSTILVVAPGMLHHVNQAISRFLVDDEIQCSNRPRSVYCTPAHMGLFSPGLCRNPHCNKDTDATVPKRY